MEDLTDSDIELARECMLARDAFRNWAKNAQDQVERWEPRRCPKAWSGLRGPLSEARVTVRRPRRLRLVGEPL